MKNNEKNIDTVIATLKTMTRKKAIAYIANNDLGFGFANFCYQQAHGKRLKHRVETPYCTFEFENYLNTNGAISICDTEIYIQFEDIISWETV